MTGQIDIFKNLLLKVISLQLSFLQELFIAFFVTSVGFSSILEAGSLNKNLAQKCSKIAGSVYKQKDLRNAILTNNPGIIYEALNREIKKVGEAVASSSKKDQIYYNSQWAGNFLGPFITTPIPALKTISEKINFRPGQLMIDIGSGHGVPSLIFGALNPGLKILGYEFVGPKVEGSKRLVNHFGLKNTRFKKQDLSHKDFHLPTADYYYLFNPVHYELTGRLLEQIIRNSNLKKSKVISYGEGWDKKLLKEKGFIKIKEFEDIKVSVWTFDN